MSRSLNEVRFIGRLGQDPELSYLQNGNDRVARFSLATDINVKNTAGEWETKTDWHRIVLWNKLADIAGQYLHKGDQVYLAGRVRHHQWTDKTSGEKKFGTEFVCNELIMLSTKRDAQSAAQTPNPATVDDDRDGIESDPSDFQSDPF